AAEPDLAARLAGLPPTRRREVVTDLVRDAVAVVLGHGGGTEVDPDRAFAELGFDSLTAVELRNQLRGRTGLVLPTTLVFDHPTPAALAEHLDGLAVVDVAGPALAGLDRVAPLVAALAGDADGGDRVAAALRALLGALTGPGAAGAGPEESADLDQASDEELFALLDELD
ncbi:acyl carrier protein, partial [Actinokineospora pegani]|uniref:acyl carrier protein n=1 Tax=Actinokineospora pegani TaxID=2654637 RepID=UPI0012EA033E